MASYYVRNAVLVESKENEHDVLISADGCSANTMDTATITISSAYSQRDCSS